MFTEHQHVVASHHWPRETNIHHILTTGPLDQGIETRPGIARQCSAWAAALPKCHNPCGELLLCITQPRHPYSTRPIEGCTFRSPRSETSVPAGMAGLVFNHFS